MNTPMDISAPWKVFSCLLLAAFFLANSKGSAAAAEYLGPDAIAASKDGKLLYVTCRDSMELVVVDVADRRIIKKIDLPAKPTGMALNPEGTKLYVTCAVPRGAICVVDTATGKIASSIPASSSPIGPVIAPDGKRLYVCNRFENDVAAIDLGSGKKIALVPAAREPCCAAITPDGKTVFAADLLPLDRADGDNVAAEIIAIDAATHRSAVIRLPNGGSIVRGLCVSPDGKYVYAVHVLARYQLPISQVERGWVNTSALSVIDACSKKLVNTVPLDDVDLGAADPWGVAATADGKRLCVTHAGTHELSVIDAVGLLEKLGKPGNHLADPAKSAENTGPAAANVPYDLSFLGHLRRRIKLEGDGPHGVAVIGSRAYVAEYFSDAIAVVDLQPDPPQLSGRIILGPKPKISSQRRGKMLFHDATLCFQHWQSCASCHPEARMDAMNWDLLNDGIGNPKNTRSLINVHESGAVMALAVRDSAKVAIQAGIKGVLFAERPEEDAEAIDTYLSSLSPIPSPRLIDGRLSPAAERGKIIFFDRKVGCAMPSRAVLHRQKSP